MRAGLPTSRRPALPHLSHQLRRRRVPHQARWASQLPHVAAKAPAAAAGNALLAYTSQPSSPTLVGFLTQHLMCLQPSWTLASFSQHASTNDMRQTSHTSKLQNQEQSHSASVSIHVSYTQRVNGNLQHHALISIVGWERLGRVRWLLKIPTLTATLWIEATSSSGGSR